MAFPDTLGLLVAYLAPIVDPVRVVTRVPKLRPAQLVQVRRAGGRDLPPVRELARIDVFTWGSSDPDAMGLALQVRSAVWALAGNDRLGVTVYSVDEFMSLRQDDDDLSDDVPDDVVAGGGHPRVWATYELAVRADDVIHAAPPAQ